MPAFQLPGWIGRSLDTALSEEEWSVSYEMLFRADPAVISSLYKAGCLSTRVFARAVLPLLKKLHIEQQGLSVCGTFLW